MSATALLLVHALITFQAQDARGWSKEPPPALRSLERARSRIRKAEFDWTHSRFKDPHSNGEKMYWRSIISGDQIAYFKDGTADGVTNWKQDGEPIRKPTAELRTPDDWWDFDRNDLIAELYRKSEDFPDFPKYSPDLRSAGLVPMVLQDRSVGQALWEWPEQVKSARRYRQREIDGLYEVEMQPDDSADIYRWYIDPAMDWNVVQCQFVYQGEVLFETFTDYESADGVWYPVVVTQFDAVGDVVQLLEVDRARINAPDIPDRLSPDLLGLGNGMPVLPRQGAPQPYDENGKYLGNYLYGSGGRLLTIPEYSRLKREGLIETDPRYEAKKKDYEGKQREIEQRSGAASGEDRGEVPTTEAGQAEKWGPSSQPTVVRNRVDDDWERYTREFTAKYELKEEQANAASRILRDCQEQRTQYLRSRRSRIVQIEERLSAKKTEGEGQRLLADLEELRKPIQDIFEKQLKPRLDKLPTRAQRAAVEGQQKPKP